jgi:hypothetical protein
MRMACLMRFFLLYFISYNFIPSSIQCYGPWFVPPSQKPTTSRRKLLFTRRLEEKVKRSHYRPGQALRVHEVEAPIYQHNRRMKVASLSAPRTGRPYPQEVFPVLISVLGCINPRATVRPEGLLKGIIAVKVKMKTRIRSLDAMKVHGDWRHTATHS